MASHVFVASVVVVDSGSGVDFVAVAIVSLICCRCCCDLSILLSILMVIMMHFFFFSVRAGVWTGGGDKGTEKTNTQVAFPSPRYYPSLVTLNSSPIFALCLPVCLSVCLCVSSLPASRNMGTLCFFLGLQKHTHTQKKNGGNYLMQLRVLLRQRAGGWVWVDRQLRGDAADAPEARQREQHRPVPDLTGAC